MNLLLQAAPFFPAQASGLARRVDWLLFALLGFSALILLVVFGLMLFFGVRYRARSTASRRGRIRNTTPIEVTWVALATVLFLAQFLWAGKVYFDMRQPPAGAASIYVVGKQWMWKVYHPGGRQEINELHVPIGQPVRLVMTSKDVIHSFYVPALRTKQDLLPDRYSHLWFQVTEPGTYRLKCAEYCGTDHSAMRGFLFAMTPSDYQRWAGAGADRIAPVPGTPGTRLAGLALEGQGEFFRLGCNACHVPGAALRAPRLDGLWRRPVLLKNGQTVTGDEQYIRESLLRPNAKISAGYAEPSLMPTYEGQLDDEQIAELIEFIKSLEYGWPEEFSPR